MDKEIIGFKMSTLFSCAGISRIGNIGRLKNLLNQHREELKTIFYDEDVKEEDIMYYESILGDFKFLDAGIYFVRNFKEIGIKKGKIRKKYFLNTKGNWMVEIQSLNSPIHYYSAFKSRRELLGYLFNLRGWELTF